MKKKLLLNALLLGSLVVAPAIAAADSISPSTFSATVGIGQTATVHKTVTVSQGGPTSALVDVMFLFDTTGSMGGLISSAQSQASTILGNLSSYGSVRYAVSDYRDFPEGDFGGSGDYAYQNHLNVPGTAAAAQTAINGLSIGWGNDLPESNLYALQHAATDTAWRTSSNRFVVWFGDSPGHTAADGGSYATENVTLANTTAALTANNIKVEAINIATGSTGIDATGQASAIATATSGAYYSSVAPSTISTVIASAISSSFSNYHQVTLDLSGVPAGVGVALTPVSYSGSYDRREDRTFDFDLTFTGITAGTYNFDVNALVDGGIIAVEGDSITVRPVPEPATMLLFGTGIAGLAGMRRKKSQKN